MTTVSDSGLSIANGLLSLADELSMSARTRIEKDISEYGSALEVNSDYCKPMGLGVDHEDQQEGGVEDNISSVHLDLLL